jgi:DNA repair protein RadC
MEQTQLSLNTTATTQICLSGRRATLTGLNVRKQITNVIREEITYRVRNLSEQALSLAEIITAVLGSQPRHSGLTEKILAHYQTLDRIARVDISELRTLGCSQREALSLRAAIELCRRMHAPDFAKKRRIENPEDVAAMFIPELRNHPVEQFHVLCLNTANQVTRRVLVSEGNLNSSIVHPREVFATAIAERAAAIIGLHNHPSGNPTPSKEDIAITKQLVEAGRIIGIPLHDHIIIAGEEYVSLAEKGYV